MRREVAAGLAGGAAVTPVLVGHAELPTTEDLPEPLKALPGRQAIEVRPEHFDDDVEELIRRMGGWRRRWRGFPLWAWALAATVVAGLLLVAFVVRRNMAPIIDPQQIEAVAGEGRGDRHPLLGDRRPRWSSSRWSPTWSRTTQGTVENLGDGRVVYTAPRDFYGNDSFGFRVSDEGREETTATAHVEVLLGAMSWGVQRCGRGARCEPERTRRSGWISQRRSTTRSSQDLGDTEIDVKVARTRSGSSSLWGHPRGPRPRPPPSSLRGSRQMWWCSGPWRVAPGQTDVAAEFFVSDRDLTGAEELSGVYPLDTIELNSDRPGCGETSHCRARSSRGSLPSLSWLWG